MWHLNHYLLLPSLLPDSKLENPLQGGAVKNIGLSLSPATSERAMVSSQEKQDIRFFILPELPVAESTF